LSNTARAPAGTDLHGYIIQKEVELTFYLFLFISLPRRPGLSNQKSEILQALPVVCFLHFPQTMKRTTSLTIGLLAVATAGAVLLAAQMLRRRRILQTVANEGYETAADVLYPRGRRHSGEHYGPVLP
jgi:hypothetical protein